MALVSLLSVVRNTVELLFYVKQKQCRLYPGKQWRTVGDFYILFWNWRIGQMYIPHCLSLFSAPLSALYLASSPSPVCVVNSISPSAWSPCDSFQVTPPRSPCRWWWAVAVSAQSDMPLQAARTGWRWAAPLATHWAGSESSWLYLGHASTRVHTHTYR